MMFFRLLIYALLIPTLLVGMLTCDLHAGETTRGNLPGKEAILGPRVQDIEQLPCDFVLGPVQIDRRGILLELQKDGSSNFLYLIPSKTETITPHPDSWKPCTEALDLLKEIISPAETPWQWDVISSKLDATAKGDPCRDSLWNKFQKTSDWPQGWQPVEAQCKDELVNLLFKNAEEQLFSLKLEKDTPSPWIKSSMFSLGAPPVQVKSQQDLNDLKKAIDELYTLSDNETLEGLWTGEMAFSSPLEWYAPLWDGNHYRVWGVHPTYVMLALQALLLLCFAILIFKFKNNRRLVLTGFAVFGLAFILRTLFGAFAISNFISDIYAGNMLANFRFGTAYPVLQSLLFYLFGHSLNVLYFANAIMGSLAAALAFAWLYRMRGDFTKALLASFVIAISPAALWVSTTEAHQSTVALLTALLLFANWELMKPKSSLLLWPVIPITAFLIVAWRPEAIIYPPLSAGVAVFYYLKHGQRKFSFRLIFILATIALATLYGLSLNMEHVGVGVVNLRLQPNSFLWPRYGWNSILAGLPLSLFFFYGIWRSWKTDKLSTLLFLALCTGVVVAYSSMIWSPMTMRDRMAYRYFVPSLPFFAYFISFGIADLSRFISDKTRNAHLEKYTQILPYALVLLVFLLSIHEYPYRMSTQDELKALEKAIPQLDENCPIHFLESDGFFGALSAPSWLPWLVDSKIETIKGLPEKDESGCYYIWEAPICDIPRDTKLANDERPEWVAPMWEKCEQLKLIEDLKLIDEYPAHERISGFENPIPDRKSRLWYRAGENKQ